MVHENVVAVIILYGIVWPKYGMAKRWYCPKEKNITDNLDAFCAAWVALIGPQLLLLAEPKTQKLEPGRQLKSWKV